MVAVDRDSGFLMASESSPSIADNNTADDNYIVVMDPEEFLDYLDEKPENNIVAARCKFHQRCQQQNETIIEYVSSLRELAAVCNFGGTEEERIRDQVVVKINSDKIRNCLLAKNNLTLDDILYICKTLESENAQNYTITQKNKLIQTEDKHTKCEVCMCGVSCVKLMDFHKRSCSSVQAEASRLLAKERAKSKTKVDPLNQTLNAVFKDHRYIKTKSSGKAKQPPRCDDEKSSEENVPPPDGATCQNIPEAYTLKDHQYGKTLRLPEINQPDDATAENATEVVAYDNTASSAENVNAANATETLSNDNAMLGVDDGAKMIFLAIDDGTMLLSELNPDNLIDNFQLTDNNNDFQLPVDEIDDAKSPDPDVVSPVDGDGDDTGVTVTPPEGRTVPGIAIAEVIVNGEMRYLCTACNKSYSHINNCQRHVRLHFGLKYSCEKCGRDFTQSTTLKTHMRVHTGERPYACSICYKRFIDKARRDHHTKRHYDINGELIPGLPSSRAVYRRRVDQIGVPPYQCAHCDKRFTSYLSQQAHMKTHTGDLLICDICGKGFALQGVLDKHKIIHTGLRPYQCEICGRTFNAIANLGRHIRTHTGEKRHKCDVCGKAFVQSNSLKVHMRTHTGEKPYLCNVCGRAFTENKGLRSHMKTHMEEKNNSFLLDIDACKFAADPLSELNM